MTIALSWSRLSDYQQCARKFYLKYIAKQFPYEDPKKSPHLVRGEQLHKQMEKYVLARKGMMEMPQDFSSEVQTTIPLIDRFIDSYPSVYPEAQIACTVKWEPTEWFGSDVGWRAIWDFTALHTDHAFIADYKTGKIYDYGNGFGQLHLSATIALNRFNNLDYVSTAYLYMEHKHTVPVKITRDELPQVQSHFENLFDEVQSEKEFKPKANEFCGWCPATVKQCPFSRKI